MRIKNILLCNNSAKRHILYRLHLSERIKTFIYINPTTQKLN